ncbi:type VI secretion system Vgr family protein [Sorangium sp. So ce388]|uniref:type VI secretion system Vgr family protein n=1 Tax=Sorangium sp. So ce388 TaxID=3133309 RepID=UPI003F5CAAEF
MPTLQIDGLSAPLRVVRYAGREAMSDAFQFEFHVITDDSQVAFADAVGKPAGFLFSEDAEAPRHVRGIIRRFEYLHHHSRHTTYRAILVPRAFRLTLRRNNRIFQGKTAPQIIEAVIGEAEIEEHTLALSGSYATREYCVQYRETDWDFINRLMEEEGIFYYFEHGADATKLVIADSPSVHNPIDGDPRLKLRRDTGALAIGEHVNSLHYGEEIRPGKITMRDYNFKTPMLLLEASSAAATDDDLEFYEYPGNYADPGAGRHLTEHRLEALQAPRKSGEGQSNCSRLIPGCTFMLDDGVGEVPREDLAQEYLVTRVDHEGHDPRMQGDSDAPGYKNLFWVVPAKVPFRPAPRTPRPRIYGVQTAVVTGAAGEEIHTDEHGRIKVQFHWDRRGKRDDKSSCWIRVAQAWAGPGFGAMYIPRVGHEVVVDFVEGDPDRPIIVGCVYHGANVPPYPLPSQKTKSTLKSSSSPGGGGSNELRFDDKAGGEEIYLHGQKDYNIKIENNKGQVVGHDEALEVGHDRAKHVKHDQSETIDGNKSIQVGGDHNENIDGNETVHVGKDHTESVGGKESITVGKTRDVIVASDQTTTIGGNHSITVSKSHDETITIAMTLNVGAASMENVGAAKSLNVGAAYAIDVGAVMSTNVGASQSTNVGANQSTSVGGSQRISVGKDQTTNAGQTIALVAGKQIAIKCGDATIDIAKNGNITVSGKDITIKGKGPIGVEGKKIQVKSDGIVKVQGSGAVTIKGSKVGIN